MSLFWKLFPSPLVFPRCDGLVAPHHPIKHLVYDNVLRKSSSQPSTFTEAILPSPPSIYREDVSRFIP